MCRHYLGFLQGVFSVAMTTGLATFFTNMYKVPGVNGHVVAHTDAIAPLVQVFDTFARIDLRWRTLELLLNT